MKFDTTEIVAAIALSGVIFSALLSAMIALITARRSIYINAVTAERIKWMNEVYSNVSQFQGDVFTLILEVNRDKDFSKKESATERASKLQVSYAKAVTMLFDRGQMAENVISIMRNIFELLGEALADNILIQKTEAAQQCITQLENYSSILSEHCNFLFSTEQNNIKVEASGLLWALLLRLKGRRLRQRYNLYCRSEGAFPVKYKRRSFNSA